MALQFPYRIHQLFSSAYLKKKGMVEGYGLYHENSAFLYDISDAE